MSTNTVMFECNLDFSPFSHCEAGSCKLLELTPDLTTSIEAALQDTKDIGLTIKGHANDDAVLCTKDKTFAMRSIVLSNTILVVTPAYRDVIDVSDGAIAIHDQVNEIIELVPIVPKLHKLSAMIRDRQYDEGREDNDREDENMTRFTYQNALEQIQASEMELIKGLIERRILILHDELRLIAPAYLDHLLQLILNLLVAHSMKHNSVPIEDLVTALADGHDVQRAVSEQVMSWFGEMKDGKWHMNVASIVKEIGLGILRNYRHEPLEKDDLLVRWKSKVGDTFESSVTLDLLVGNYIETDVLGSMSINLKYFPASALPIDPAARFSELFLTRSKWKADELSPFLTDIAVNSKERDRLLLKYCRTISGTQGVKYTARVQYSG